MSQRTRSNPRLNSAPPPAPVTPSIHDEDAPEMYPTTPAPSPTEAAPVPTEPAVLDPDPFATIQAASTVFAREQAKLDTLAQTKKSLEPLVAEARSIARAMRKLYGKYALFLGRAGGLDWFQLGRLLGDQTVASITHAASRQYEEIVDRFAAYPRQLEDLGNQVERMTASQVGIAGYSEGVPDKVRRMVDGAREIVAYTEREIVALQATVQTIADRLKARVPEAKQIAEKLASATGFTPVLPSDHAPKPGAQTRAISQVDGWQERI